MLFFHGHEWQLVPGRSVLEARICREHQTSAEVTWNWEAHFIAAGGCWRRVRLSDRPSLEVRVGFFEPVAAMECLPLRTEEGGLLALATRPDLGMEAGEVMKQWPPAVFFQTEPGRPRRTRGARNPPRGRQLWCSLPRLSVKRS